MAGLPVLLPLTPMQPLGLAPLFLLHPYHLGLLHLLVKPAKVAAWRSSCRHQRARRSRHQLLPRHDAAPVRQLGEVRSWARACSQPALGFTACFFAGDYDLLKAPCG